jgi:SAM-dependent methyltransferase
MGTRWYETFYGRDYLDIYDFYLTPERTADEVEFIQRSLALQPGARVLDLCSGHGRHALPLSRLGLRVTGIDQSREYLAKAVEASEEAGLHFDNLQADMRYLPFRACFDAAINIFSSFGYLENDGEDAMVLKAVAKVLKPGGRFLIDLLNREWAIRNFQANDWHAGPDGTLYLEHRELDLETGRQHVTFTAIAPDASRREIEGHHIRLYTLRELSGMLAAAGLYVRAVYGNFDGQPYGIDSRRLIVLAETSRHQVS